MKLKTKLFLPMLTVIVLLGLSSTAFAQNSCGVASTPVSRDTNTGLTEVAGDLIFNCTFGGTATTTATMTVSYGGVMITNSTTYPALPAPGKPIALANVSGSFAPAACTPTISSVNNVGGQIVINLPAMGGGAACPAPAAPFTGSYTLTGALIALNGTGLTTLNSNISVSPGNNVLITAGQNVATVVTTILPGILDPKLTPATAAGVVLTSGIAITPGFSVTITENYIDMFRSSDQFDSGFGTNSTQLALTFTGIPTGVTLGGCTAVPTTGAATLSAAALTSAANTVTVSWTTGAGPSLTATDSVVVACTSFTAGATATIPLTAGSITVQATLAPTGAALGAGNAVLVAATTGQIPRYASTLQPATPLAVLNIIPSQTNLLIPFATSSIGYDTGISIANTTADPFGGTTLGSARAQSGTVTFTFYPQTGTPCSFTPSSATPGVGLSSTGAIASGVTYSVLLSQLLLAAPTGCNFAGGFTGYIFEVANFTNAHGAAFVSDFKSFTSGENVLVVPPPALPGNNRSLATVEALGH